MENKLKELSEFVCNVVKIENKIAENKLSHSEVKALLQMVDVKGKGFLDLNDVYDLVGKVTENELFTIFKFFDTERTGEIRLQQLQQCLGDTSISSNNTSKEYIFPRFYSIVDTIKDKPKLIGQAKSKMGLNTAQLKGTYEYICSLVQSKYLTNTEFVTVLKAQAIKYGLKWGKEQQNVVYEMLPGQNVSEAKFIECFSCEKKKEEVEEENLLAGIENPVCSSQQQQKQLRKPFIQESMTKHFKPLKYQKVDEDISSNSIIFKKTNKFFEKTQTDTPSFRQNNFSVVTPPANEQAPFKREFQQIQGNINGVLDAIQQRRERLRQDSMERKKLIDEVMNRKRQGCGMGQSKGYSSPKESYRRPEEVNMSSFLNTIQTSANKSYLTNNHYNTSSPKQQNYPQYNLPSSYYSNQHSTQPNFYPSQNKYRQTQPSEFQMYSTDFRYNNRPSSPQVSRPQTPVASSTANPDINQILKKYSNNKYSTPGKPEDDTNTLKQLCKSKSGALYCQNSSSYLSFSSKYSNSWQQQGLRYPGPQQGNFSAKMRTASKENVMKRAEEEAARKIEQIERKARMKVLEKKNAMGKNDKQGREWRPLAKKGTYY